MTESYGFKFVVDANDAAKGWKQFESAVEGVFKSLDKMESHVDKTMAAVNKATKSGKTNITAFTKAANELGRIKVNASAAKNITTLSAAMKGFKAPSATQVKNTQAFFKALGNAGTGGGATAGRNIAALNASMAGFKAPSATNVRNLRDFFGAVSTFRAPSGLTNAAGFISTLRQLAGFRAPGAAQVRNLQAFLNTVSNLQIPRNGAQIANVLDQIARAASSSNASLRGLRGSLGGMPWGSFNGGAQSARLNMMGLQNAFSGTFQVGSALRVLLGSLTIGELGTKFFEATNAALQFKAQMSVVSKEIGFAGLQLDYVNEVASRFGVDMLAAESGFAKISIAADKSGMSVYQTRNIFEGMTTAMAVLGVTTAGQGDVWLALQQVMNKGYLSAEELNQQLNEKLPGAMAYAGEYAASLGLTLEKGLKTKALDAAGVLEYMSKRMTEDFGPAMAGALDRPSAQMNILKNNFMSFFQAIGENGGNQAFVDLLKAINEQLTPEKIDAYSRAIGETLKGAVDNVTAAFAFLRDNWDSIKGPLSVTLDLLGKWMIISSALQIGRFIIQPLMMIGGATGGIRAVGASMGGLLAVARASTGGIMGMIGAAQGLTGVSRILATQMIAARNAIYMAGVACQGASVGTQILAGAMLSLRGAAAAAMLGLRGFLALLGGPMMIGLVAVTAAIYMFYDAYSNGNSVLADTKNVIEGVNEKLNDGTGALFTNKSAAGSNTTQQGLLGNAYSTASGYLVTYRQQMDKATDGLYSMAEQARATRIELLKTAKADLTGQLDKVEQNMPGYYRRERSRNQDRYNKGEIGGGTYAVNDIYNGIRGGVQGAASLFGFAPPEAVLNKQRGQITGKIGTINQEIAATMAEPNERIRSRMQGYRGASPRPETPEETESKKGPKGRKGPKAPDPAKELDKLQRLADSLIRRLGEDNPVLKLQGEYMTDLTEQAQALLTDDAYKSFNDRVGTYQGNVDKILQDLQKTMTGTGVDAKLLTDLEARYGITIADVTAQMERANDVFKAKTKLAEDSLKPGHDLLKLKAEELRYGRMSSDQMDVLKTVQEEVNKFKDGENRMSQEAIDLLTTQITLQQQRLKLMDAERDFYENNGLKKYTSEIQTAGEAVQEMDYNVMRSLEDTIFRIGKEGKFSLKGVFDTIQDGLLKFASQGITEKLGGLLSGIGGKGDPNNPSMMGKLFGAMGFDTGFDKQKAMDRIQAQTVNLYTGRINVNGEVETSIGGFMSNANADGALTADGAKPPATLAEEISKPILDNVQAAGKLIKTDWGGAIQSMGPLIGSALGAGLGGLIGGKTGSAIGGIASLLLPMIIPGMPKGIFKEGGFSDKPVAWSRAPHYSEGTANTSGGKPAILHDNEAVIPLSRGRKVPVTLTNTGGGGSGTVINNVWNVQSPDADSFQRSQQQMTGQMHRAATRAAQRNS